MSTELQFPDSRHNHSPRCCCDDLPELGGTGPCPACPDHGELAPTVECPQCHQPAGRPHTEYCSLAIREEIFAGEVEAIPVVEGLLHKTPESIHPMELGCCKYNPAVLSRILVGQASQPTTRTSQPATQHRISPNHVIVDGVRGPEIVELGQPTVIHRISPTESHLVSECPGDCRVHPPIDRYTPRHMQRLHQDPDHGCDQDCYWPGCGPTDHEHCPTCESCTPATRNLYVVDGQPCTDPWHDREPTPLATPTPLCPCAYQTGPVSHIPTCPEYLTE